LSQPTCWNEKKNNALKKKIGKNNKGKKKKGQTPPQEKLNWQKKTGGAEKKWGTKI